MCIRDRNNVTLKLDKSKLIAKEEQFLGFQLNSQGITPSTEKVDAIQRFPMPKNMKIVKKHLVQPQKV